MFVFQRPGKEVLFIILDQRFHSLFVETRDVMTQRMSVVMWKLESLLAVMVFYLIVFGSRCSAYVG